MSKSLTNQHSINTANKTNANAKNMQKGQPHNNSEYKLKIKPEIIFGKVIEGKELQQYQTSVANSI